jgi:Flp pilus assembly protein TadD
METMPGGSGSDAWSQPVTPAAASVTAATGDLEIGTLLAGRYEIVQLLGQGGMGAVYKARDKDLDRNVALKLIRPELAKNPEILRRFKQELILARQITHKNVIRIFDLGQFGHIKFITMDFVEGQDLRHLLKDKGKFPPQEAARIMLQICRALEAAHAEGVIHRDLKPPNIMLDASGRVYVMDFGIARSAHLPGMTETGALIGTPEYMSPEQARGEKLTPQSDIFSLGVIFYELLTGKTPYPADAPLGTLWKRLAEKAKPPIEIEPTLPKALNDIVVKALELDLKDRFASAREMANQLEIWLGPSADGSTIFLPAPQTHAYWKWATAGLAGVVVLAVATVVTLRLRGPTNLAVAHSPMSILVADFENHTGDAIFDNTLEPMFNVALEGASFINAYSRGDARRLAGKLDKPSAKLDDQSARLVAISQGINAIVTGSLVSRGDGYRLSVEVIDAATAKTLANAEMNAANKDEVLLDVPKLAAPLRKALGDTTPQSVQLAATQGSFASSNLEAVHQYGLGMEEQFAGKMQDALQSFTKATDLDPNFARAYSGMAAASRNLGQRQDAENYIKVAMQHTDRMTERERFRLRGTYYILTGDWKKCIDEYSSLIKQYPVDNIGHGNLAYCYSNVPDMANAVKEQRRAVELSPNSSAQRMNLSVYATYAGDFQTSEEQAHAVLKMNSAYEKGYLALAYAQMGQDHMDKAGETYRLLDKVSTLGKSYATAGLSDLDTYQGQFAAAAKMLEAGAAADLEAKRPDLAAAKFSALANVNLLRNQKAQALSAITKALANGKGGKLQFLSARLYVAAGEVAKARDLAAGLSSAVSPESQAYGKLIQGELALLDKKPSDAVKTFTEAANLADTWIGHFDLGRAYIDAGLFVEADSEFDSCAKRRGEAMELFMGDMPTFSYFAPVYYFQGRAREGLKTASFKESYQTYLNIRGKAGEDPLLPEIRKRLAQ